MSDEIRTDVPKPRRTYTEIEVLLIFAFGIIIGAKWW